MENINIENIKRKIEDLIIRGFNNEAIELLEKLIEKNIKDVEIYSMYSVVLNMSGEYYKAINTCLEGLDIEPNNFDLNYNLACLYESIKEYSKALTYFNIALNECKNEALKENINNIINSEMYKEYNIQNKIVFFVKRGLDSFLHDIINELSKDYIVKKVIVDDFSYIDKWMEWADISWFEWCDELVGYGSRLSIANMKKIVCRIHRYEVFTDYIYNVNWNNVDKVLFVSEHIRNILIQKIKLDKEKSEIIYNGINLEKFKFYKKEKGFNLALIGYLNLRKNPMLVIQYLNELVKVDSRYKLFIAGEFQDESLYYYMKEIIEKMNLSNNVQFDGFIKNDKINDWLKDKHYIITGSIAEGHPVGIMEAMSCGLKPVIHYFPGAEDIYTSKYIYKDLSGFLEIIMNEDFKSSEYRDFIKKKYSFKSQISGIKDILEELIKDNLYINNAVNIISKVYCNEFKSNDIENIEDLTFVIPSFNRCSMLYNDLKNNLKFSNIDKFIVDDASDEENKIILNEIIKEKSKYNIKELTLSKNNNGLAHTRNIAIDRSDSNFIGFLDDDDCLISLDNKYELKRIINKLNEDVVMIIPRYVFNLYENGEIDIGCDRKSFNNGLASEILRLFILTGEIYMFNVGAIYEIKEIKNSKPEDFFKFAEDFIMLSRVLGNNLSKKIKVIETNFFIRRRSTGSLVASLNEEKIFMHLIAIVVGAYYCLKKRVISKEEFLEAFKKRYMLLQSIYGIGKEIGALIENYINYRINIDVFIKQAKKFIYNIEAKDLPHEFFSILKY